VRQTLRVFGETDRANGFADPNTDSPSKSILMKRPDPSRGSAAKKSATHSNDVSTETIGTPPEEPNGFSTETTGTPPEEPNSSSIGTIDPTETSYFIQYQPELAEKLSKHSSTYSVSGRCLSIVFSRMLYWSRFAKHRHNGKLFYWKNQTELSQETSFSIKQINRALKVLVELGLIIREKFMKHRYYQCYFYHIPLSPHTKELPPPTRSRNSTSRTPSAPQPLQQFHHPSGAAPAARKPPEPVGPSTSRSTGGPAGAAPAARKPPEPVGPSTSRSTGGPAGAVPASGAAPVAPHPSRTINRSRGFGTNGTNRTHHSTKISSSIKQTLLSIVQKCESYGNKDIYDKRFSLQPK
jgi:hypothetical protein